MVMAVDDRMSPPTGDQPTIDGERGSSGLSTTSMIAIDTVSEAKARRTADATPSPDARSGRRVSA